MFDFALMWETLITSVHGCGLVLNCSVLAAHSAPFYDHVMYGGGISVSRERHFLIMVALLAIAPITIYIAITKVKRKQEKEQIM